MQIMQSCFAVLFKRNIYRRHQVSRLMSFCANPGSGHSSAFCREAQMSSPGHVHQLLWEEADAFPGQMRNLISPAVLGLPLCLLPTGHAENTPPGRRQEGILNSCSNQQLASLQSRGCILSRQQKSKLFTPSLRLHHHTAGQATLLGCVHDL